MQVLEPTNYFITGNYKRSITPIKTIVDTYEKYVMKRYNVSEDKAKELVKKFLKQCDFRDPMVEYNVKDLKTLDMSEETTTMSDYIAKVSASTLTLAPSMTAYTKVQYDGTPFPSKQAKWTEVNKDERKVYKKRARKARSEGDMTTFKIENTKQVAKKKNNNTLSGASSILIYPQSRHSTHYSLTSYTSTVTSTANLMTESMVMGNRFYITPSDVLNHFTLIITHEDKKKAQLANDTFNLYIPTVDDVMAMVAYNTFYYWRDDDAMRVIEEFVQTLDGLERSMVLYGNDLYHMTMYNKELIEGLLTRMTTPTDALSTDIEIVKSAPEYEVNLMHHILMDELRGKGLNYDSFKGSELGNTMASTILRIREVLHEMRYIIMGYFSTVILPPNIDKTKQGVRRAIILSDTDSTCAHYTILLKNRYGDKLKFNSGTVGYAAALSLFNAETNASAIKLLCLNMNIDADKVHTVSMKSEFFWTGFIPTEGSKHYYERAHVQEHEILGSGDTKGTTTVHGVGLIANQTLTKYNDIKMDLVDDVLDSIESNSKISLREKIDMVIKLEDEIIDAINNGDRNILTTENIMNPESYKLSWEKTKYKFHYMYKKAFAQKYGSIAEPPYKAYKVNITIKSAKDFDKFIESIKDFDVREAFEAYHKEYPVKSMTQFLIPMDIVKSKGIPEELSSIIDYTKIVEMLLAPIYTVMQTLGVYKRDNLLFRDYY